MGEPNYGLPRVMRVEGGGGVPVHVNLPPMQVTVPPPIVQPVPVELTMPPPQIAIQNSVRMYVLGKDMPLPDSASFVTVLANRPDNPPENPILLLPISAAYEQIANVRETNPDNLSNTDVVSKQIVQQLIERAFQARPGRQRREVEENNQAEGGGDQANEQPLTATELQFLLGPYVTGDAMEARIKVLLDFYLPMFVQKTDLESALRSLRAEVTELKQKTASLK
ncbi:ORF09R [Marbled eel polyomavirus]|uniref:ORF09R n=1 Tax=Marbled eel polyomavirus TaxID=1662286 RepID=UPI0007C19D82|nr:ORF09R [Marbled eel polyomavirus]ANC70198.1 ORF09R [Marbled eel polyomavirus]